MINFIILAAGNGTRMKSDLPKIMHKICGFSLLETITRQISLLNYENKKICVLSNNIKDNYLEIIPKDLTISIQQEPLGTGHAVLSALDKINPKFEQTIIMYADNPLFSKKSMERVIESLLNYDLCLLSFIEKDKNNYGKLILKNETLIDRDLIEIIRIKEEKEFEDNEARSIFCNAGFIGIKTDVLLKNINKINNNNIKNEYYITDIVEILSNQNMKNCAIVVDRNEAIGINSQAELAYATKIMQNNLRKKFMDQGVCLMDPDTVYFSQDTIIGKNVIIEPNVFIDTNVEISSNTTIKSFSRLN